MPFLFIYIDFMTPRCQVTNRWQFNGHFDCYSQLQYITESAFLYIAPDEY